MSELRYPVPWDVVASLGPHVAQGTAASFDDVTAAIAGRMHPPPLVLGTEHLPEDAGFVLAANHYQRPGLWIAHTASALTQAMRRRYGPGDPPVRWVVTANWPPLRIGPWRFRSPGDVLLPRVARVLSCYPVPFAGSDPRFAARSLRALLRDAETFPRPIGIFPEGARALAGQLGPALPGAGRLLVRLGRPVVPAGVLDDGERLLLRFGQPLPPADLANSIDPGNLVLRAIAALLPA